MYLFVALLLRFINIDVFYSRGDTAVKHHTSTTTEKTGNIRLTYD